MVLFPAHEEHAISARRERCAEVRDVFVLEGRRRRGVARSVMTALEAAAREAGHHRIGLSVSLDDEAVPARALYSSLGYRPAHGPYVTSSNLAGDDGPIRVWAILRYLVKDLSEPPAAASSSLRAR
jgi:GNAT superfamily N-acetyltransferase